MTPSMRGSWLAITTSASPAWYPSNTGSDRKSAITPMRAAPATSRIDAGEDRRGRPRAPTYRTGSPPASGATVTATIIAVEASRAITSWRDDPSAA